MENQVEAVEVEEVEEVVELLDAELDLIGGEGMATVTAMNSVNFSPELPHELALTCS